MAMKNNNQIIPYYSVKIKQFYGNKWNNLKGIWQMPGDGGLARYMVQ